MTAKLDSNPLRSTSGDSEIVSGRIIGGTTAATKVAKSGSGWTVAYVSTGVCTITFDKKYNQMHGCAFTCMSSATHLVARVSAYSVSAHTITVTTFVGDTGTATDLGAADELWFVAHMKTGSV